MSKLHLTRAAALLLAGIFLCSTLPAQEPQETLSKRDQERRLVKPDPKLAKKLAERAAKEQAAGDNIAALDDYEEAARYAPFDVTIVAKGAALRSRLLREHVDAAERLAVDGNLDGAAMELAAALEIDPHNPALLERLQQIGSMKASALGGPEEPAEGLPRLAPARATRSFSLQTDVKSAYEQIAQAYGLKAIFDPDLPARTTKLHLEKVDFFTAAKILAIETGTFWIPVDSGRFLVAGDTSEKRRELEPELEQTFALPNANGSAEMGEVVRSIRELTGLQHVSQSIGSNSITVRGPVGRVWLAGQIVRNLEHAPGEILLEIDLLEVDRTNARKLGVIPPASTTLYSIPPNLARSLRSAPDLSTLLTLLTQVFGSAAGAAGGVASLATAIPPIAAIGGGKTTFLLGLPTFTAQFSQALSLVHSGREVLLRAQDGKPATFFVGDRYPITLSLLSGSLGSTSFTANPGGTPITIPTEQFTVGNNPVAMISADFRNAGTLDLAVVNQSDNTLTILLNQGTGAASQFAQTTGSPISLSTLASGTKPIVSPAASLTVSSSTLQSIAITPASPSIANGTHLQFIATGKYSDGSTQNITTQVTWGSASTNVATIDALGLATAVGPGTTQITATMGTMVSAPAKLGVTSASLQAIAVAPANPAIAAGTKQQFTATGTFSDGSTQDISLDVIWATSASSVAVIGRSNGAATGVTSGSAQITASSGSLTSAAATLKVTAATLQSITISPATATIPIGATQQWSAAGTFSDGTTQDITNSVRWASSNSATATINGSTGLSKGIGAGTTQITATQGGVGVPTAIASGEINTKNNSFAGLLVTEQVTNSVIVLTGNGDGTFAIQPNPILVGAEPTSIVVGTFNTKNGDSNPGFVVTNFKDNTYSVFTGNGDGTFTPVTGSPFPLPATATGPVAMTVADFNNDGLPDLAIVNQATKNVTILEGNGNGTFTEFNKSPLAVGNLPVAIASGSLSGSTGPGLAIVNQEDDSVTVYLGNGDGTFFESSQSLATSNTPTGVAIADFTQQGNGGIAVANTGAGTVTVFADLGSGLFTNALEPQAGTNPTALVAGAFTNSTFPDVAVTNNISGADGQVTLIVSPVSVISNSAINAQQPYPGSEYEDIGLKIKATPQLHETKDVTLQLEFEIKALSGTSVNGIPVISNRTVTQTVRLKENETSLVVGLLDQQENKTLTGFPGLAALPGVGYLFGAHNNSFTDDELIFLITPRRMRSPFRQSKTIYAGTGEPGTGGRGAGAGGVPVREREEPAPAPAPSVPGPPPATPGAPPVGQPPGQQPPANQPPANQPEVPLERPPE